MLLASLLLAQPASAVSYPLTIPFDRSWPMSVVVDSARGLVYLDAVSGEYPPTGYSFGVINVTTHTLAKTLPLNVSAGPMVLDQGTGDVYVGGSTSIAVLDGKTLAFVRQYSVGHPILSMAHDGSVSPDIFFTSGAELLALNPQTGAIVGKATFASNVDGVAIDPLNDRLYVGLYPSPVIAVLDASSLAQVGTITLPACCALQFTLDQRTQTLYSATGTNYVYAVSAATDTYLRELQVAPSPQNATNFVAADNATGSVFVASSPGGSVIELDGNTGAVRATFRVSSQVAGIALDTKTQEVYASNYHQITVFDAARTRLFLLAIIVGGALVVLAVVGVFLFIRHKDERERMKVQMGWSQAK